MIDRRANQVGDGQPVQDGVKIPLDRQPLLCDNAKQGESDR